MNVFRLVGIVPEVLSQPPRQVPDAGHKERYQNCASSYTKRLPEWRLNHRHKKCGEKERDGGEDCPLALHVLVPIILEDLIDDPIPARLGGKIGGSLRVRIVVQAQKGRFPRALVELLIMKGALLGINQRVVRERKNGKVARSLFRSPIHIRVAFTRQLAISGLDLSRGRCPLNSENVIVVSHCKGQCFMRAKQLIRSLSQRQFSEILTFP